MPEAIPILSKGDKSVIGSAATSIRVTSFSAAIASSSFFVVSAFAKLYAHKTLKSSHLWAIRDKL